MKPEQIIAIEAVNQSLKSARDCGALDLIHDYCVFPETVNDFCTAVESALESPQADVAEIRWDEAASINSSGEDIHIADYVAYDGVFIQCVAESLDGVLAAADQWKEDMETDCDFKFYKVVE